MRRLCGAVLAAVALAVTAAPVHASDAGSIDHIETSAAGDVKLLYSVPGAAGDSPDLDSVVVEVDGQKVEAAASPVEAGEIDRTALLALDVSESMRGRRFAAAQEAALAYLKNAPTDVSIGLLTFAGSVDVVSPPTTDHASLADDVRSLTLARGTRLYDGVLTALDQVGAEGSRQVVVLSDGADTSGTRLEDVVAAARESGTRVNVVALEQTSANEAKLRRITDASDGKVLPANDPAALADVFTAEADALAQQILVEFASATTGEARVSVSLDVSGHTYRDSTFTSLNAPDEQEAPLQGPLPVRPEQPVFHVGDTLMYVGVGAVGASLALALVAAFVGKSARRQTLAEQHLAHYATHSSRNFSPASHEQTQVNVRESLVSLAEQVVQKGDFEERLGTKLSAAGITLTPAEWLLMHAGVSVLASVVGLLLSGGNWLVVALCLLPGAAGPWLFLSLKRSKRIRAFNGQLADTLQLMSGGLSAGLSLPQAVDTVVREGAEPMSGELRRALVEQRLGVEIEDALDAVAERMESKDFAWVVMAIRIQREVGGNLAELLNTVSATLREREYLRRQVLTLSAEGRLSAWILGALPPFFVAYLGVSRPEYLQPLVTTTVGWAISGMAVLMLLAGAFWLAKTVKVEV